MISSIRHGRDSGAERRVRDPDGLGKGDQDAGNQLIGIVYQELRRLAAHYLKSERADHTLQPTALVHEL